MRCIAERLEHRAIAARHEQHGLRLELAVEHSVEHESGEHESGEHESGEHESVEHESIERVEYQ